MIRKLHALHSDLLFVKSLKTAMYRLPLSLNMFCYLYYDEIGEKFYNSCNPVFTKDETRVRYFICINIKTKNKVFIKIFWFIQMLFTAVEIMETRENKCSFTLLLSLFFLTELSKISSLSTAGFCLFRFENTIKQNYYRVPNLISNYCMLLSQKCFHFLSLKLNFKKNL